MVRLQKTLPPKSEFYPPGTFLETEAGVFYVNSSNKRLRFSTRRVLASWAPQRLLQASESDPAVKRLKVGLANMKFRNGSLIYSQYDGKMYFVSETKLRHITNPDWLHILGYTRNDAVWVSKSEIEIHEIGEPLS